MNKSCKSNESKQFDRKNALRFALGGNVVKGAATPGLEGVRGGPSANDLGARVPGLDDPLRQAYAHGGPIKHSKKGKFPKNQGPDDKHIVAAGGEYILPNETVDALGGPAVLDKLVRATTGKNPGPITNGSRLRQFTGGGGVDGIDPVTGQRTTTTIANGVKETITHPQAPFKFTPAEEAANSMRWREINQAQTAAHNEANAARMAAEQSAARSFEQRGGPTAPARPTLAPAPAVPTATHKDFSRELIDESKLRAADARAVNQAMPRTAPAAPSMLADDVVKQGLARGSPMPANFEGTNPEWKTSKLEALRGKLPGGGGAPAAAGPGVLTRGANWLAKDVVGRGGAWTAAAYAARPHVSALAEHAAKGVAGLMGLPAPLSPEQEQQLVSAGPGPKPNYKHDMSGEALWNSLGKFTGQQYFDDYRGDVAPGPNMPSKKPAAPAKEIGDPGAFNVMPAKSGNAGNPDAFRAYNDDDRKQYIAQVGNSFYGRGHGPADDKPYGFAQIQQQRANIAALEGELPSRGNGQQGEDAWTREGRERSSRLRAEERQEGIRSLINQGKYGSARTMVAQDANEVSRQNADRMFQSSMMGHDVTRRGQDLMRESSLEGHRVQERGQDIQNTSALRRMEFDNMWKNREYAAQRGDKAYEQTRQGMDDYNNYLKQYVTRPNKDGKHEFDPEAAMRIDQLVMGTLHDLKIDPRMALSAMSPAEQREMVRRAKIIDSTEGDRQGLWGKFRTWMSGQPFYQAGSILDANPTGIEPGAFADLVQTPRGAETVSEHTKGRNNIWPISSGHTHIRDAERVQSLRDKQRGE